ncbi:receptor expression-enhancing protein 2 isoform X2 [Drosophila biarmipes]|uniref:receptor expression-enhancing protein 2 isoform X2 n=1 Tax=Drosophila biarmipes TaxID=125945 RepID=UPI0021CC7B41|nr:receptor expression-enhancing protein 2 isoform X2 [Drosophila biarmipes]
MLRLIYIYYGTLLPGWNTLRALSHGQRHFIVLWLKYWVIHALLQAFGVLTDFFAGGLPFYAALKLILSVGLWFSAPYSSNHLYNIIKKYVMGKLEPIVEQGFRWHATLGRAEQWTQGQQASVETRTFKSHGRNRNGSSRATQEGVLQRK